MTDGSRAEGRAARSLIGEVLATWWALAPVLLPAVLAGYLLNGLQLAVKVASDAAGATTLGAGLGVLRAALLVAASWLGATWTAAAVLAGRHGLAWRLWRAAWPGLPVAGVARALVVYAPLMVVGLAAAAQPATPQQAGEPRFLPVALLVFVPLALNFAALTALLPAVTVAERPAGAVAGLRRAFALSEAVFVPLLVWGGLGFLVVALTSFLPADQPVLFPNHVAGSLLWVLAAVAYRRARSRLERDWEPSKLV